MTKQFRKIATEEAFAIPEQMEAMRELVRKSDRYDPDLFLWDFMARGGELTQRLLDLEGERLRIMDEAGIDVQLLALTSTGVQMLDAERGTVLAKLANDRLAELIRKHPRRFAGLCTIAPQDPAAAAREIERSITALKLNGVMINSHTHGEYLDVPNSCRSWKPPWRSMCRSTFIRARPRHGWPLPIAITTSSTPSGDTRSR